MKISNSISEINLNYYQNNKIISEKAYIWPIYNAGKVEEITGITRRTETITYSKPSSEDREKIISLSKKYSENEYTSNGSIKHAQLVIQPGSLFDALI